MSRSASSSGFCLTVSATLGAVRWFACCQFHAVQHHHQVLCVRHDLSPVIVQHSFPLEMFIPRAHLVHCPDFQRIFCERFAGICSSARCHRVHMYLSEHIQLVVCKRIVVLRHICRNSALQGVLPGSLPSVFQRVSDHTTIQLFPQSSKHGGPIPQAACCSNHTAGGST